MFELARRLEIGRLRVCEQRGRVGRAAHYGVEIVGPDAELHPTSHYQGVFKVANEQGARVFRDADGISASGCARTRRMAPDVTRASPRSRRLR